jgi:hypothetical protein
MNGELLIKNYELLDEVKYLFLINKNNKLIYKTIFF